MADIFSGVWGAVDKFLGGTGGEPVTQQADRSVAPVITSDVGESAYYSAPGESSIPDSGVSAVITPQVSEQREQTIVSQQPEIRTEIPETSIGGEYDLVGTGASKEERAAYERQIERGPSKVTSTIIQTPEQPTADISTYYKDVTGAGGGAFTPFKDLGDRQTQQLIAEGYTPEQALAQQMIAARDAGDIRAGNYYEMQLRTAATARSDLEAQYDKAGTKSGLAVGPNPYEATSLAAHDIIEALDRGATDKQILQRANVLAEVERSGAVPQISPPTTTISGVTRILSLEEQQAEQRGAAASSKAAGWEIDESAFKRTEALKNIAPAFGIGIGGYKKAEVPTEGFVWTQHPLLQSGQATTSSILGVDAITGIAEKRGATPPLKLSLGSEAVINPEAVIAGTEVSTRETDVAIEATSPVVRRTYDVSEKIGGVSGALVGGFGPAGVIGIVGGGELGKSVGKEVGIKLGEMGITQVRKKGEPLEAGISSDLVPSIVKSGGKAIGTVVGAGIGTMAYGPAGTVIGGIVGGSPEGRKVVGEIGEAVIKSPETVTKLPEGVVDFTKNVVFSKTKETEEKPLSLIKTPTVIDVTGAAEKLAVSPPPGETAPVITEDLSKGSWTDRRLRKVNTGIGTGESLGGYRLENILAPLTSPTGMTNKYASQWELGKPRRSKPTLPSVKRKKTFYPKSQSKKFDLDTLKKNISSSKAIQDSVFEVKAPSLTVAKSSIGSSFDTIKISKNKKHDVISSVKIPSVDGNKSSKLANKNITNNIENIVGAITKTTKIKKVKVK